MDWVLFVSGVLVGAVLAICGAIWLLIRNFRPPF
jgi:hypothetical protein